MIHISITIRDRPMEIVLHKFETKVTMPKERNAAHTAYTFLYPLLRKVARSFQARFRVVE